MAINIKFTKFDNTPWGFRLVGGSDFPQPLTVIRVSEGSLAECMGLQVGDVVVRLNDQPVSNLTHGQAHEALMLAGNNFVLGVLREESPKVAEAIPEDNIVPYTIPLEELPPVVFEETKVEEILVHQEETIVQRKEEEDEEPPPPTEPVEVLPEKPTDQNSEPVPNKNLTDEEIAQLILEEEELLPEQGVLGVNFKKLKLRVPLLKDSKVFEELQTIATAEPPKVQELKRTTTFLQKPERPIPKPRPAREERSATPEDTYKVVIKKQPKKSITTLLLEKGLLEPGAVIQPGPPSERPTPAATPDVQLPQEGVESEPPTHKRSETPLDEDNKSTVSTGEGEIAEDQRNESIDERSCDTIEETNVEESMGSVSRAKIQELVSTEISLEKQLESVQKQLVALKQLPSEIENHIKIVSDQLRKIMELSGVRSESLGNGMQEEGQRRDEEYEEERYSPQTSETRSSFLEDRDRCSTPACEVPEIVETYSDTVERQTTEETKQAEELEISVKSGEEESRVKKFVVSYESKVIASREPSPAPSHGSFQPDPNLSPKDQVIQELQQRQGKKRSEQQDLWPQAKQLELTYGRKWRCPNDFFNDDMIAEVLSSQAEVIRGRALGVNFKKFEKTYLPNYDHLMNSSVYKMIHKMEQEPKKGIPARPPKVNAAEDILERVKSPSVDRNTTVC